MKPPSAPGERRTSAASAFSTVRRRPIGAASERVDHGTTHGVREPGVPSGPRTITAPDGRGSASATGSVPPPSGPPAVEISCSVRVGPRPEKTRASSSSAPVAASEPRSATTVTAPSARPVRAADHGGTRAAPGGRAHRDGTARSHEAQAPQLAAHPRGDGLVAGGPGAPMRAADRPSAVGHSRRAGAVEGLARRAASSTARGSSRSEKATSTTANITGIQPAR